MSPDLENQPSCGTLFPAAATSLNKATNLNSEEHDLIDGLDKLDKCIDINQVLLAGPLDQIDIHWNIHL